MGSRRFAPLIHELLYGGFQFLYRLPKFGIIAA
jgi:hypothetical protein